MELFSNLSDDQIALVGCAAALASTGTLMCLSHFIGRRRLNASSAASRHSEHAAGEMAESAGTADAKRRSAA